MTLQRLSESLIVRESRYTFGTDCVILGSGTFGETVKVLDRMTKGSVVIHKINSGEFFPDEKAQFQDKLERIVQCRHMFIVPVLGYSLESPTLIVTQFENGGSLQDALDKWNKLRWFSDTARTMIAIGIVTAMQYLLEMGLFHGNLKPSNIMLDMIDDDQVVPRVAEFGLVEFAKDRKDEDGYDAGDSEFTEKSDVYSFGQILGDMFESRRETGRSKSIEKLISKCSKNPNQRPSFQQIFKMFEAHEVEFPKTDRKVVDLFLKQIREQEKRRKRRKFKYLLTITPDFVNDLMNTANSLPENDGIFFFQTLAHNFKHETPFDAFAPMLSISRKLTETQVFADAFVAAQLHLRLPFDREDLIEMTFPILLNLANNASHCIDEKMANILAFLLPRHERKVLRIVSDYARHINKIENPWPLLDTILVHWQKIQQERSFFISIQFYLCRFFMTYLEARGDAVKEIAYRCVKISTDDKVVRSALGLISEFFNDELLFKPSFFVKFLTTPRMVKAAVSLLLCANKFKIPDNLINTLLPVARVSERAGMLLTKLAGTKKGAQQLIKRLEFMENELPTWRATFRTVLVLLQTEKKDPRIILNSESLAILMSELGKSRSIADIGSVINFATVVPLGPPMIKFLDAYGFFAFRDRPEFTDNHRYISLLFNLLGNFALKTDLPIYSSVIASARKVVEKFTQTHRYVLRFLTAVSRFQQYAEQLEALNVTSLFAALVEKHGKYQQQIDIINRNAKAYAQQNKRKRPGTPDSLRSYREEESECEDESDSYGYFMSGVI